ncbi:DUF4358 domain-containing protein [Lachnospiraceae bacterium 45-P1]
MKKNKYFTSLMLSAALTASFLTGCSGSPAAKETTAQETVAAADVSLDDILSAVKEAYNDGYMPDSQIDSQILNDVMGISPELCESYVAEMPMVSTFVETFIGVKAKEGKGADVEKALTDYREYLLNDTMQYPMNVSKIQASQVIRHGDYVFFVMLGGPDDDAMEKGDEAALKSAEENNQIAVDVINGFFS